MHRFLIADSKPTGPLLRTLHPFVDLFITIPALETRLSLSRIPPSVPCFPPSSSPVSRVALSASWFGDVRLSSGSCEMHSIAPVLLCSEQCLQCLVRDTRCSRRDLNIRYEFTTWGGTTAKRQKYKVEAGYWRLRKDRHRSRRLAQGERRDVSVLSRRSDSSQRKGRLLTVREEFRIGDPTISVFRVKGVIKLLLLKPGSIRTSVLISQTTEDRQQSGIRGRR